MTEETTTRPGWRMRPVGSARLAIMTLTCSGAVLIAGCTSSGTSASKAPKTSGTSAARRSPAGTASAAAAAGAKASSVACVHINSLRTSLTSLTHVKVSAASASKLTTDLGNMQSELGALKGQHLGAFSAKANELMARLNKINKDAAELNSSPTKAAMALNSDLTNLKTKAGPMIAEMRVVCRKG